VEQPSAPSLRVLGPAHRRDVFRAGDPGTWPALMTSEHVAALDVSIRTLWRLLAAGQLPQPVRLNRKLVRFRKADIVAWLGG
jgi:predicted DNA-binding transcriptional regulator AlpA